MKNGKNSARHVAALLLWSMAAAGGSLSLGVACTPPVGPGDPECTIDADCGTSEVCSATGDCVPGDTGSNGDPDPECVTDGDCPDNEVCGSNGVCVPDDGGPGPDPDPVVDCTTNSECDSGELCTPDGICVPEAGELPCRLDSECGPDEVCTAAGFCADADDPDPPGPGGGGGGGGGPAPDCTTNSDCAANEVCQGGLCAPAPGEPNPAAALAGCWRITFATAGVGSSVAIYQFDAQGRLERTWGVSALGDQTVEEVRYTVPNATFFGGLYGLTEQVVVLDENQTALQMSTALLTYGFGASGGECLVRRTTSCTDLALFEATLSGDPPSTIVSGTFVGSHTCESTVGLPPGDAVFDGTITGERLAGCPDITLPAVESQEEQVDLCP